MSLARNLSRHIAIFALIAVVLLAQIGCTDSDYRKACRAAAGIATGLHALEDTNEQLYNSGLLSKDEARAISQGVIAATQVDDQFIAKIKAAKSISGDTKQLAGAWFGEVLTSLEALNQQGILGVKNPDAKAKLDAAFQTIQVSVAVVSTFLTSNGVVIRQDSTSRQLALAPFFNARVFASAPPPAPRTIIELPAGFDADAACRAMVTPSDIEAKRCPNRASIRQIQFGGAL